MKAHPLKGAGWNVLMATLPHLTGMMAAIALRKGVTLIVPNVVAALRSAMALSAVTT